MVEHKASSTQLFTLVMGGSFGEKVDSYLVYLVVKDVLWWLMMANICPQCSKFAKNVQWLLMAEGARFTGMLSTVCWSTRLNGQPSSIMINHQCQAGGVNIPACIQPVFLLKS